MWQLSDGVIYDPSTGITYFRQGGAVQLCSVHDSGDEAKITMFKYEDAKVIWPLLVERVRIEKMRQNSVFIFAKNEKG